MSTNPQATGVAKNYNARRKIVVFAVLPALLIATTVGAIPLVLIFGTDLTSLIIPSLFLTILAEIGVIFWALWYAGLLKNWREATFFNNFKWIHLLYGFIFGQVAYWGLQLVAVLMGALGFTFESSDTSTSLFATPGVLGLIVIFLIVPFVGPFIEEFLFRGVMIGSLQKSTWNAPWISILISALVFGVLHIQGFSSFTDYALLAWITLIGAGFAWLFLKTKSFWAAFIAHSVYNLTSSIFAFSGIGG